MKPKCWYEMSLPREINYTQSLFLTLSMGRNMLRVAQLHVNVLRPRCRNWPIVHKTVCPFTNQTIWTYLPKCILVSFSIFTTPTPLALTPKKREAGRR